MLMVARQTTFSEEQTRSTAVMPVQPLSVDPASWFLNRELSLVQFHGRVLEEALDIQNPLLERLKFLSIFASNIDEFFMIRIAGLKSESGKAVVEDPAQEPTAATQLGEIRNLLRPLIARQAKVLERELLPQLKSAGIEIANYESLNTIERHLLNTFFVERVFPVLTPLAVDLSHPFPYISPLSLNLGLMVETPPSDDSATSRDDRLTVRFVRIEIPAAVPRLVAVPAAHAKFILLEDLIVANIGSLFCGTIPGECHRFRVTRDADIEIEEEDSDDLVDSLEQELLRRRFGAPVRLEVSPTMPDEMVQYLAASLELDRDDVYVVNGALRVQDLMTLYDLERPDLKDEPFEPTIPDLLATRTSIFEVISQQDVLLHHPFHSYRSVTDFVDAAVSDPDVVAIKICLYRTGPDSPIPPALIKASERGTQVTALIELRARFDEAHNIEWAKRLDEAGVHVVYGILGLKTHGKLTLVVRREGDLLRRYVHIASGNYNPTTSCTYTDLSLFTADEEIGADASEFFNYLTGCSNQKEYRQLVVAPANLRERMNALIDREVAHQRAGRPAGIVAKMNRLADREIIQRLYSASQAGVSIDLIVRGICMLRPGVPGLSETIRVRSIVGRFLEHSRIFSFVNGGEQEVYMGSADWMHRNLAQRVEVVAPVRDADLKRYLMDDVLLAYLRDNVKAQRLLPNGMYERCSNAFAPRPFSAQEYFMNAKQGEDSDHASTD